MPTTTTSGSGCQKLTHLHYTITELPINQSRMRDQEKQMLSSPPNQHQISRCYELHSRWESSAWHSTDPLPAQRQCHVGHPGWLAGCQSTTGLRAWWARRRPAGWRSACRCLLGGWTVCPGAEAVALWDCCLNRRKSTVSDMGTASRCQKQVRVHTGFGRPNLQPFQGLLSRTTSFFFSFLLRT